MTANWLDDNQHALALEFRRLAAILDGAEDAEAEAGLASLRADCGAPPAIDALADAFGLSRFERGLVLLLAGVELDKEIGERVLQATGGAGPSAGFALARLDEPHWSAFSTARPLFGWRIIERETRAPLIAASLKLSIRVVEFLLGINAPDEVLTAMVARVDCRHPVCETHRDAAGRLSRIWRTGAGPAPLLNLVGDDPDGADDVAALIAERLGLDLLAVDAADIPQEPAARRGFAVLCEREAALLPALLLARCPATPPASFFAFAETVRSPLIVASPAAVPLRRASLRETVRRPEPPERKRLWLEALGTRGTAMNGALDGVAAQFRFSARAIATTGAAVAAADAESAEAALWGACRGGDCSGLDALAERISPMAVWDDLVLPGPQIAVLRHIAGQVSRRARVLDEWGFGRRSRRGLGTSALFAGGSGTGKTLAAEVLASELKLSLYRIDLSAVVSKYIGDTEKNIRQIFDVADDTGAILLFDEADALFGKRSDVKDSHDRYANIEVSYLLQRMEVYRGLAILTSNLKSALDPAFQRRLRFIVDFPFPDAEGREAIWRLSIPSGAPTDGIDHAKLSRLNVPGGAIRNVALNAAFLAAEADEPIGMRHLLSAAHAESAKLERPLGAAETRGWI